MGKAKQYPDIFCHLFLICLIVFWHSCRELCVKLHIHHIQECKKKKFSVHMLKSIKCTNPLLSIPPIKEPFSKLFQLIDMSYGILPSTVIVLPGYSSLEPLFKSLENENSLSDSMNFEWVRLRSFASFRCTVNVSPIVLARTGFYYTGSDSTVKCYSCGVNWNDWSRNERIIEIHHRISPNCLHLRGSDERNVPIEHRNVTRATRLQNFSHNNQHIYGSSSPTTGQFINNRQQPQPTHNTPTSYSGHFENKRRCVPQSINLQLQTDSQSIINDRPDGISSSGASNQQMNISGVSSATINKLFPLGVNFDKPRYPQYAVLTVRMSTYNGWPATQSPRKMAEAGFIYAGYADYTRCFFCGGGLRNWEEGDDPWIEHAQWFPNCTYVRQNKGIHFVHRVQQCVNEKLKQAEENAIASGQQESQTLSYQKPCEATSITNNQCHRTEFKHLASYQSVLDMGYAPDLIESAVQQLVKQGIVKFTSSDILEVIFRFEEDIDGALQEETRLPAQAVNIPCMQGEAASLLEENRRLREQRLCMICVEKDSCIAFLPCGHLVCCEECAPAMKKCPKCQQVVQGSLTTWLV